MSPNTHFLKSFFGCEIFVSGKRDSSSVNNLGFEDKLSVRLLIQIKKKIRPRTDPSGTPVCKLAQDEA